MRQLSQRPTKSIFVCCLLLPLLVGCTTTEAVDRPTYRSSTTTHTADDQARFTEAQLDSLLAPIALYPDTVLSHVLIASTYPLEVVEADRWARKNTRYKGDDAVDAVEHYDWDPSVKALVAFPDILRRMSEDLEWTQQLGDAFLADEERVMDSVQTLRNRAYASGNLDKVEHVRVIREEKTIVIEPSVERVVYVPAYDTRVVYGSWWWPDYPPVYWHYPSSYVFVSGFYWGPRVYIGPRFYFSGCHWRHRRVYVVDRHHHHGHRFYDSRSVVRHVNATRWNHNPAHRRGVAYYDRRTRERFNSPRESYHESRAYRANLNDQRASNGEARRSDRNLSNRNPTIAPNQARETRQHRSDEFQQRLERRQAGQLNTPPRAVDREERMQSRAEQLRERIDARADARAGLSTRSNIPATSRVERNERLRAERTDTQRTDRSQTPRADRVETQDTDRTQMPRVESEQSQYRYQAPERPSQRIERSERIQPRLESRPDRMERFRENGGTRELRSRESQGEMRGGRER